MPHPHPHAPRPRPSLGARLARALSRGPRIALELGPHSARILLARRATAPGEPIRIQRALLAELRADGLLGPAEMAARLRALLAGLPPAPVTLVLPAGRVHSQLLKLRPGESRAPADLARAVGGGRFDPAANLLDARALAPSPDGTRPVWVSVAREHDVAELLARAGLPLERVERVIGADAAMAAAFATLPARPPLAVLIELGATEGLLVVVEDDQPLFAADLDWGADQFAEALASDLGCTPVQAIAILERDGADALNEATPRLSARLNGLRLAIEALLRDHAREAGRAAETLLEAPRWFSGVGLATGRASEPFGRALAAAGQPAAGWPSIPVLGAAEPLALGGGVFAYGAAALALGRGPEAPNLAPVPVRSARRSLLWVGVLHFAALSFTALGLATAAFALHTRNARVEAREAELLALRAARDSAPPLLAARAERETAYRETLPALYFQKRTRDFIAGTRLLRERRTEADFWFALVADTETYQSGALPQATPAAAPETQLFTGLFTRPSGLIVELSFRPGGPDPLDRVGELIAELRDSGVFSGVDILPPRARRPGLADRSVFAAEGAAYSLQLDSAPFGGAAATPSSASSPAPSSSSGLFSNAVP
jgi:hypothetical protein